MTVAIRIFGVLVVWVFVCTYQLVIGDELAYFGKLNLPEEVTAPESLAFNKKGNEFYTGVSGGKIHAFVDFATTSPLRCVFFNRTNFMAINEMNEIYMLMSSSLVFFRTKPICDGRNVTNLGQVSCRSLGLAINYNNDDLFIYMWIIGSGI